MELLEWIKALSPFVLLLVSTLLAIAGFFGKKIVNDVIAEQSAIRQEQANLKESQATMKEELMEHQARAKEEFLRFRGELPFTYITRDDHIRHITILEHKIDESRRESNAAMTNIQNDIKTLIREIPKRNGDG